MRAYLAAGWFTEDQEYVRSLLRKMLITVKMDHYSPKDDCLYTPGGNITPRDAFMENINEIAKADIVLASTVGKDMGALFECGYAYAMNKPIIYFWQGGGPFNLMLSQSAHAVFTQATELVLYLSKCNTNNTVEFIPYNGEHE